MVKNVKRKVTMSVITICCLLVLLAGSTYALFSDKAPVNVIVSSAKVDISAKIQEDSVTLYSLDEKRVDAEGKLLNTFELGGEAILNVETGEVTLINIAPGDKIEFTIEVTNESNIDIKQRIRLAETIELNPDGTQVPHDKCLLTGDNPLVVKINGVALSYNPTTKTAIVSDWTTIKPGPTPTTITVSIELPYEADDYYQNLSCAFDIIVDAYQGNADTQNLG